MIVKNGLYHALLSRFFVVNDERVDKMLCVEKTSDMDGAMIATCLTPDRGLVFVPLGWVNCKTLHYIREDEKNLKILPYNFLKDDTCVLINDQDFFDSVVESYSAWVNRNFEIYQYHMPALDIPYYIRKHYKDKNLIGLSIQGENSLLKARVYHDKDNIILFRFEDGTRKKDGHMLVCRHELDDQNKLVPVAIYTKEIPMNYLPY